MRPFYAWFAAGLISAIVVWAARLWLDPSSTSTGPSSPYDAAFATVYAIGFVSTLASVTVGSVYAPILHKIRQEQLPRPLFDIMACILSSAFWMTIYCYLPAYHGNERFESFWTRHVISAIGWGALVGILYWMFAGFPKAPYRRP